MAVIKQPGTTLSQSATGNHSMMCVAVAIYLDHLSISALSAVGSLHLLIQYQEGASVSVVTADVRCFSGRTAVQYRSASSAR